MDPATVLRDARRRSGLTQSELARRAGTSQPVISAYERGHRDPTSATLQRLVESTGHRLRIDAVPIPTCDIEPPVDVAEHGRRLIEVLGLADAIPARARSPVLRAPRLVSR